MEMRPPSWMPEPPLTFDIPSPRCYFCFCVFRSSSLLSLLSLFSPAPARTNVQMPIFSYMGIMATESGMVDLKDLLPHIAMLYPSSRKRLRELPRTRLKLVTELKAFVKQFGPTLGEIYYEKEVDWAKVVRGLKPKTT